MTRPSRGRAIRAQLKAKEEMRHMTGWPPSELMQDDSKELSHWFSEKPDAMRLIRERCAEIEAERSFTLPNGTEIDPSTPWQLPQQTEGRK